MDPDVTLALGLSTLAESKASYPEEWDDTPGSHAKQLRSDAREFAQSLFDWICKGGYYPKDRDGCDRLLMEFGYDPNPARFADLDELAEYYETHDSITDQPLRHCRECSTLETEPHKMDCATGRGYGVWRNDPWI